MGKGNVISRPETFSLGGAGLCDEDSHQLYPLGNRERSSGV